MKDATTATANISAPCGMTNEMPNDAELQKAYARLDKHMCYFLWQDAWKQPTASAYVDQLLKEVPNAVSDPLKGRLACVTGVTQAHRNGAYLDANGTPCMPRLPSLDKISTSWERRYTSRPTSFVINCSKCERTPY